jgi:hypothetical protein
LINLSFLTLVLVMRCEPVVENAVAVSMLEAFGYMQLELTDRELGAGLIIEAGVKAGADPSAR